MTIWMKVTKDEYELPLCVADSAKELAEKVGTTKASVETLASKYKNGRIKKSSYVKVEEE